MVRRQLIAWTLSATSVVGTAGLTIVQVTTSDTGTIAKAAPARPPATVVVDQYIDDYVTVPAAPPGTAAPNAEATSVPPASPSTPAAAAPQAVAATLTTPTTAPHAAHDPNSDDDGDGDNLRPDDDHHGAPALPVTGPTRPRTGGSGSTPAPDTNSTATGGNTPPTAPPASTTTLPPGTEVPRDWPAGTPYPPIPAGCRKPHLEDDGRWNCDH